MELNGKILSMDVKGESREIRFDKIGFIRRLDEIYKAEKSGIDFGFGIMLANVYLEQFSIPALANVIKCGLFKEKGVSLQHVDEAIETISDEGNLEELFVLVDEALGKSQLVAVTLKKMAEKAEKEGVKEAE